MLFRIKIKNIKVLLSELPPKVTTLDLSLNKLNTLDPKELNGVFSKLPPEVTTLTLSWNELGKLEPKKLKTALSDLSQVTTLDLSGNELGRLEPEELNAVFSKLPPKVTTLDLSRNKLDTLQRRGKLNTALSDLSQVTILNLIGNELGTLQRGELNAVLSALSPKVTTLDLSCNRLGTLERGKLNAALSALSPKVTTLNLSDNELGKLSDKVLVEVLQAIPTTVTSLTLGKDTFKLESRLMTSLSRRHGFSIPPLVEKPSKIAILAYHARLRPTLQTVSELTSGRWKDSEDSKKFLSSKADKESLLHTESEDFLKEFVMDNSVADLIVLIHQYPTLVEMMVGLVLDSKCPDIVKSSFFQALWKHNNLSTEAEISLTLANNQTKKLMETQERVKALEGNLEEQSTALMKTKKTVENLEGNLDTLMKMMQQCMSGRSPTLRSSTSTANLFPPRKKMALDDNTGDTESGAGLLIWP